MLLQVVDGLEPLSDGGYPDMIKSVRQSVLVTPLTVVFDDCFRHASVPLVQNLLMGSICRLSLNDSIASLSSCIIQSVNVCTSEEEKLSKVCIPNLSSLSSNGKLEAQKKTPLVKHILATFAKFSWRPRFSKLSYVKHYC